MVFRDPGIMLFFFALPLVYPIVYSLIYNPEVTRDMPVAVVDADRTSLSREFVRHADANEDMRLRLQYRGGQTLVGRKEMFRGDIYSIRLF